MGNQTSIMRRLGALFRPRPPEPVAAPRLSEREVAELAAGRGNYSLAFTPAFPGDLFGPEHYAAGEAALKVLGEAGADAKWIETHCSIGGVEGEVSWIMLDGPESRARLALIASAILAGLPNDYVPTITIALGVPGRTGLTPAEARVLKRALGPVDDPIPTQEAS